jgi:hypothetical protein
VETCVCPGYSLVETCIRPGCSPVNHTAALTLTCDSGLVSCGCDRWWMRKFS